MAEKDKSSTELRDALSGEPDRVPATGGSQYRYSLAVYIAQVGIAILLLGVVIWSVLEDLVRGSPIAIVIVALSGWILWKILYEAYKSPREIVVSGTELRTRSFHGDESTYHLASLRLSKKKPVFGNFEVYEESGDFAFRIYAWLSRYEDLRDLILLKGGYWESPER